MWKFEIDEWLVRIVEFMYKEVRSRVRVGDEYSNSFDVWVGFHQCSVLSLLLFAIVLEVLFVEFHTGRPWEISEVENMELEDGEKGVEWEYG